MAASEREAKSEEIAKISTGAFPLPKALDDSVLWRLQAGDRAAAAEFIQRYGPLIRRRVRGKLSPSARRVFDSQEILATVARRFDAFVAGHRLTTGDEAGVMALVLRMAETAVIDKSRVLQRSRRLEAEDGPFVYALRQRMENADARNADGATQELARLFELVPTPAERELLTLRLHGLSHGSIAWMLGISTDTARQRWQALRDYLRSQWERGALE